MVESPGSEASPGNKENVETITAKSKDSPDGKNKSLEKNDSSKSKSRFIIKG